MHLEKLKLTLPKVHALIFQNRFYFLFLLFVLICFVLL